MSRVHARSTWRDGPRVDHGRRCDSAGSLLTVDKDTLLLHSISRLLRAIQKLAASDFSGRRGARLPGGAFSGQQLPLALSSPTWTATIDKS